MNTDFDDIIFEKARVHGLDPILIKAIIQAESNFDPRAYRYERHINDASRGLMQILLGTARWMGYTGDAGDDQTRSGGLYDPRTNIEYGTRYLKYLRNRFAGDLGKMISGYNTGPGNVRIGPDGRFSNQAYVDRVLRFFRSARSATAQAEQNRGMILQPHIPQIGPVRSSADVVVETESDSLWDSMVDLFGDRQTTMFAITAAAALAVGLLMGKRR